MRTLARLAPKEVPPVLVSPKEGEVMEEARREMKKEGKTTRHGASTYTGVTD